MRKTLFIALVFFVLMFIPALEAFAEDILLSHTLDGVTEGTDTATLDITLHVENVGASALNNLHLTCFPSPVITADNVAVNVASIGAGETIDVPITIWTTLPFDQTVFDQEPFFCGGGYENADGSSTIVKFPNVSYDNGGAL